VLELSAKVAENFTGFKEKVAPKYPTTTLQIKSLEGIQVTR
jgi:hypothetical protein